MDDKHLNNLNGNSYIVGIREKVLMLEAEDRVCIVASIISLQTD